MAQLQGFPACCGAQILTGLYGDQAGATEQQKASNMPAETEFHYFTVAITSPTQHNNKSVVKALESRGFEQVLEFTGNGNTQLHLWARGRNWKPLAGAKGNMKQEKPGCTCNPDVEEKQVLCPWCKAVWAAAKKVNAAHLKKMASQVSRQPAGKKSQTKRSTHGRGSSSSRSRTETNA